MLKKMVILGVLGFVAVTALGGTKVASYIRSEWRDARERAESNIPPEKEIARLRNEVKLLDKDIVAVINEVAKQRVAVNDLQAQADELAAKQGRDKELLTARIDALEKAQGQVTFGNRTLSVAEAKAELDAATRRWESTQKSLDALTALHANRVKVRDNLEKQLDAMKAQKAELTAAVDDMEAQLTALKLQQMESKYQTDDTRLARIKEDLRKLRGKVDVEREKLKLMPAALDAPAAPPATTDDFRSRLNGKPAAPKAEAKVPTAD